MIMHINATLNNINMNVDELDDIEFINNNSMKQYFYRLQNYFGYNALNSCNYVAIGMVMSYYDAYLNDSIIQDCYDQASSLYSYSPNLSFGESPGIKSEKQILQSHYNSILSTQGYYTLDDYLNFIEANVGNYYHLHLLESAISEFGTPTNPNYFALTFYQVYEFLSSYLDSPATISYTYTNIESFVRNKIDQGVPVILSIVNPNDFMGHTVVAYDYDLDGTIYFHNGIDSTRETLAESNYSQYYAALAFEINKPHNCSNNYYYESDYYCMCDLDGTHPNHTHKYKYCYTKIDTKYHYSKCICDDSIIENHSISISSIVGIGLNIFANCKYCNALLKIEIDGPIQGELSIFKPLYFPVENKLLGGRKDEED